MSSSNAEEQDLTAPTEALPGIVEEMPEGAALPSAEEIEIDDKMIARVGRIQDAYAAGDIDEKMIARAAKAIGISEEEARRRLSSRVTQRTKSTAGQADRRKRAKQARASRKRNRG